MKNDKNKQKQNATKVETKVETAKAETAKAETAVVKAETDKSMESGELVLKDPGPNPKIGKFEKTSDQLASFLGLGGKEDSNGNLFIDPSKIRVHDSLQVQGRSPKWADVLKIAHSIHECGQLSPISVVFVKNVRDGSTVAVVTKGHHRLYAIRALSLSEAQIVIDHNFGVGDNQIQAVADNSNRVALTPPQMVMAVCKAFVDAGVLFEGDMEGGLTKENRKKRADLIKQTAAATGHSAQHIRNIVRIGKQIHPTILNPENGTGLWAEQPGKIGLEGALALVEKPQAEQLKVWNGGDTKPKESGSESSDKVVKDPKLTKKEFEAFEQKLLNYKDSTVSDPEIAQEIKDNQLWFLEGIRFVLFGQASDPTIPGDPSPDRKISYKDLMEILSTVNEG